MCRAKQLASQGRPARTTSFDCGCRGCKWCDPNWLNWKLWRLRCIYSEFGLVDLHLGDQSFFSRCSNPFCNFWRASWRPYVRGYDDCVVRSASWKARINIHLENESCCCCKLRGMQVGWAVSKQGERLQELCPNPFLDTKPCVGYFQSVIFFLHFFFPNKSGSYSIYSAFYVYYYRIL